MQNNDAAEKSAKSEKRPRHRSPPYPAIPLDKAIERAVELHPKALHHAVPISVLANAWDYGVKSSGLFAAIAALKQFGLLSDQGSGDKRRFSLTSDAMRIVKDPDPSSEKRRSAIKAAAMAPRIHVELWEKFGAPSASGELDVMIKGHLTLDRAEDGAAPYSGKAADELIAEYKHTLSFSGLLDGDGVSDELGEQEEASNLDNPILTAPKEGDRVQWTTSEGVDQFQESALVLGLSDCGQWVFTDEGASAIPVQEVTVVSENKVDAANPPPPPAHVLAALEAKRSGEGKNNDPLPTGFKKAVFPLDGDQEATLIFPKGMTADQLEDLDSYLEVFLKKQRKSASSS